MVVSPKVDYHTYMASREWRLKRKEVIEANGGWCYRCQSAQISDVHHLTYERLGLEDVNTDLQGLCGPCHEFISGLSEEDPAIEILSRILTEQGLRLCDFKAYGLGRWFTALLPNGRFWEVWFMPTTTPEPWRRSRTLVVEVWPGVQAHFLGGP